MRMAVAKWDPNQVDYQLNVNRHLPHPHFPKLQVFNDTITSDKVTLNHVGMSRCTYD